MISRVINYQVGVVKIVGRVVERQVGMVEKIARFVKSRFSSQDSRRISVIEYGKS